MEIKNTTKFSKEAYYTLNKAINSKIYIAIIIFEILLGGLACLFIFKNQDYVKGIIIGILMLIYPFVLMLIMNIQIKRNYELNKLVYQSMVYDYTFTEKELLVTTTNNNLSNNCKLLYSAIYKLVDSDKFLFIFISSNQAYLVDKACFKNKEEEYRVIQIIKENNVKYTFKNVKLK